MSKDPDHPWNKQPHTNDEQAKYGAPDAWRKALDQPFDPSKTVTIVAGNADGTERMVHKGEPGFDELLKEAENWRKAEQREPLSSDSVARKYIRACFDKTGLVHDGTVAELAAFYEHLITNVELIPKDEVEAMLADAMGVSKASVWAELGTRRGFGTRVDAVKTVTMRKIGDMDALKCNSCHHEWLPSWQTANFCPGCGAKIIQ